MLVLELRRIRLEAQRLRRKKRLAYYFERMSREKVFSGVASFNPERGYVPTPWWQKIIKWIKSFYEKS